MIAGLEEISSGELWIGDKQVNDVEPKDRDIAMVIQNYALYPPVSYTHLHSPDSGLPMLLRMEDWSLQCVRSDIFRGTMMQLRYWRR